MHKAQYLWLALLAPCSAYATQASVAASSASSVTSQLTNLVLGLVLVIGLIVLLAWLVKRLQRITPSSGQVIKIIAHQHLGPRDRLVLVQVGQEQVLLGLTAGRITPLHTLKEPVVVGDNHAATPEFAQRLMELLGKDQKDKS